MDTNINEYNLEQLVDEIVKCQSVIEEMQAAESVLKGTVLDRLVAKKLTGLKVGNRFVGIVKRNVFTNVKLSIAEELGCTTKKIDTEKLGNLLKKGIKIDGVKTISFVTIKESKT